MQVWFEYNINPFEGLKVLVKFHFSLKITGLEIILLSTASEKLYSTPKHFNERFSVLQDKGKGKETKFQPLLSKT